MEALFLLIPLSLLGIGVAIWFFFRMSDSGQFDDLDSPAHGVLLDDDRPARPPAGPADAPARPADIPARPGNAADRHRGGATSPPED